MRNVVLWIALIWLQPANFIRIQVTICKIIWPNSNDHGSCKAIAVGACCWGGLVASCTRLHVMKRTSELSSSFAGKSG